MYCLFVIFGEFGFLCYVIFRFSEIIGIGFRVYWLFRKLIVNLNVYIRIFNLSFFC